MGGNSSKSAVQQTNEFFNKTTNSFVSENSQKVSASSLNLNKVSLQRSNFAGCRPIVIKQSITSDTVATGQMSVENQNSLSEKLKNDAKAAIDNQAATKTGFLAPSVANSSTATTNLKTKVTNIIENTMKSKTVQDIFAHANNQNDADFSEMYAPCDPSYKYDGKCNSDDQTGCALYVDQNIKSTVVAKGIADAITKNLTDVITENTTDTKVKNKATTETSGLDSLFSPYTILALVACCCCCILLAGVLFMLNSPSQPQA